MKAGDRIRHLRNEISDIIELLLAEQSNPSIGWNPTADLVEFEKRFELRMELPGLQANEITIEIQDRHLKVRGEKRRLPSEPKAQRYHLMERYIGPFEAVIEIPRAILPRTSTARLDNGILIISLDKVTDKRNRCYTIPIEEDRSANE